MDSMVAMTPQVSHKPDVTSNHSTVRFIMQMQITSYYIGVSIVRVLEITRRIISQSNNIIKWQSK